MSSAHDKMNFKTPSFKEASGTTNKYSKGVDAKFSTIEHNANSRLLFSPLGPSFSTLSMNVVDYVTSEIGLFLYKLYLPKNDVNALSIGRNCLNFG